MIAVERLIRILEAEILEHTWAREIHDGIMGGSISVAALKDFFGVVPPTAYYKVRYTEDERGLFEVVDSLARPY